MKKIVATFIFALLSSGLIAEETTNNNQQQIKRNSFSIDFGMASNRVMESVKYVGEYADETDTFTPYEHNSDFDAKANLSMNYLRKLDMLDNKLSIGTELQIFSIGKLEYNYYNERSFGNTTAITKSETELSYGMPLNIMLLGQYELIKFKQFDLSLQAGIGMAVHYLNEKYSYIEKENGIITYSESFDGNDTSITPSAKIGLVGYYNINDSFAVGLSTHYVYTGKAKFNLDDVDFKLKNKGTTTANISLKYMF